MEARPSRGPRDPSAGSAPEGAGPAGPGAVRGARERALVLAVETVLKGFLLAFLGIATVKFHGMLDRLGVAWWKGLPVTLAFAAAALWSARGAVRGAAELWRGRSA